MIEIHVIQDDSSTLSDAWPEVAIVSLRPYHSIRTYGDGSWCIDVGHASTYHGDKEGLARYALDFPHP